jgi:hypothetical protein
MPNLVLDSEELSLLRACVALVIGEVVARGVSNIIKNKNRKLKKLYLKLEAGEES